MMVPNPPSTPLLVFDGDCGFCRSWVARWRRIAGDQIAYEPYQQAAARFPTIPRRRFRDAVQLIMPSGEVFEGAEAVFRTLGLGAAPPQAARHRRWLRAYQTVPGAAVVSEWGYRWVAGHRPLLTRLTTFLYGPLPDNDGNLGPTAAREMAAARRRRLALAGGLGAILLLGGTAVWRRRARRRHS
jgi:predicted DCC family thiol-disulfide oxidoreductase YuxK